jgi:ABC-type nickel/cobalt efflux system permease component RcnA
MLALLTAWLLGPGSMARAHPVPQGSHDRTLTVRLTQQAVIVEYRLEVDPWTIIYQDLPAVKNQDELSRLAEPAEFFGVFTSLYAPRLTAGLRATLDGQPLVLAPEHSRHEILPDHIRCDFVFRAPWKLPPAGSYRFDFRDTNFQGKPGQVKVSLATAAGVQLRPVPVPPRTTPEEAHSSLRTDFTLVDPSQAPASEPEQQAGDASPRPPGEDSGLLGLFFDSRRAFWWLLVMAVGLGAVHALTPGHGKTLVAAYLVGERGTVWHAVVLGLVTTFTHTGVVLVLAAVLWLGFPEGISDDQRGGIQRGLELGGGILVAGLGFWLLLRRLEGKADHVHLGGSGHHHHHHHHDHDHDHTHHHHDHTHTHSHPAQGGWRALIALGIQGGIVPCWDAVALLVVAVTMNKLWWALPLLLAFSAGLAGVLVTIGILVVQTKLLAGKRWENSRAFRALPLISAVLVSLLGLGLCFKAVRGV